MTPECLNLSIEQKFSMHRFETDSHTLTPEELRKLLIEAVRQLYVKDNVIHYLLKNVAL